MEQASELNFLTALLPLAGIVFIIAFGVIVLNQHFQKNLYRQILSNEELKSYHQQELLRSTIEAQDDERKKIAADLHDELGATLSITRMQMVQLEQHVEGKNLASLQNLRSLTEAALTSMRRISHELMPHQLESFGLVKTLQEVTKQLEETKNIRINFSAADDLRWSIPIELGLYRISMELINNTLKHAEASYIGIQINQLNGYVSLIYQDDGKGLSKSSQSGGLGFKNMQARTNALGGNMSIDNHKIRGVIAEIKIPLSLV